MSALLLRGAINPATTQARRLASLGATGIPRKSEACQGILLPLVEMPRSERGISTG
jgi:hypothetical protein